MGDEDLNEKILAALNAMNIDELSYTIGRYSGPQNASLCEKKFGFTIPKKIAQAVYEQRVVEDILLGQVPTNDKIEE